MAWNPHDPQGNESKKIKYEIVPYTRGYGLDLGCGLSKPYSHFIGVDVVCPVCSDTRAHRPNCPGSWSINLFHVANHLPIFASQSLDFVFSSHLLEHMDNPGKVLAEWWRLIRQGGHLVLYLPHKNFYPNIGEYGSNPDHKHDFIPKDIVELMKENCDCWDLIRSEERDMDQEYSFLQVYKKTNERSQLYSYSKPKPDKTCAVVRYGGIGDMVMMSSVLPGLKRQGFHVTMFTTPRAKQYVSNDPHIDEFIVQDENQVPMHELFEFWKVQAKKYHRWINLTETVETNFLAVPGMTMHAWPQAGRHALIGDKNYLEIQHKIAGVPYKPNPKFYPTEKEAKWAQKQRMKIPGRVLLWVLAGSSLHKAWPYMDQVIAGLMLHHPDTYVVLSGDNLCKILEQGWEKEGRVIGTSGDWSVRQTMAFAQTADIVIGPETGILNGVSHENVAKIITLSHSSKENLTRDWVNCISLEPEGCQCYPCHMLHKDKGHEFCNMHRDVGVADCQMKIAPERMTNAIETHLRNIQQNRRVA